jgi:hypothetical protein
VSAPVGNRLACPECGSAEFIGENVSGWREIAGAWMTPGGVIMPERPFGKVEDPEHDSFFCSGPKCNVDRELSVREMVQLGRDGKPLTVVEGQEALDV